MWKHAIDMLNIASLSSSRNFKDGYVHAGLEFLAPLIVLVISLLRQIVLDVIYGDVISRKNPLSDE
jgi:hypothetical protein